LHRPGWTGCTAHRSDGDHERAVALRQQLTQREHRHEAGLELQDLLDAAFGRLGVFPWQILRQLAPIRGRIEEDVNRGISGLG